MFNKLQIAFILSSAFTAYYIIKQIRKNQLNIGSSIGWILWCFILIIFSCIPQIPFFLSNLLGFQSPSNFLLVIFVFFLYITVFLQNSKINKLEERQKELIQKITLYKYDIDEKQHNH